MIIASPLALAYIFSGAVIPSSPSAVTSCSRTSDVSRSKKRPLLRIFFRENVMLVVEHVERLRQLERIARQKRRLLRRHRRVHARVERSRQHHQLP